MSQLALNPCHCVFPGSLTVSKQYVNIVVVLEKVPASTLNLLSGKDYARFNYKRGGG
jgi:hypothetical protein